MSEPEEKFSSEDAWTAHIAGMLGRRGDVSTGIGDDAAVVRAPARDQDLIYTTDAVIESVHFMPGTEPGRIGHKMAGRLLSDLAAMGAEPDHVLLNLVVPPQTSARFLEELYRGARDLLARYNSVIIGGDTARGSPLALHGFATGHLPSGSAVLRSGARAGDGIYVTGQLGGSSGGRHLDFEPRVREGIWLRAERWATAMMDVSDGLARDLPRLCRASGTGAMLEEARIPGTTGLDRALTEGEDYELLFTVPMERTAAFEKAWSVFSRLTCSRIGTMNAQSGAIGIVRRDGTSQPLPGQGFDHFG